MTHDTRGTGQPITGMDIGAQLAEALGLPRGTNLIQIRVGLDEAVEVICRYYPDTEAAMRMQAVLRRYHVIPTEEYSAGMASEHAVQMPVYHKVD